MDSRSFTEKVCALLRIIPRGRVVTYGKLAQMLGDVRLARAVGNALHRNPDGEKYPCYRVVNGRGELSSAYAFGGVEEQKRRLMEDGILVENNKVNLEKYGIDGMTLETPRLVLRPWCVEDAADLFEFAKDPEVGPPAGWRPHASVENSRQIIRDVLCAPETYAVCLKESGKPIGSIGLHRNDLAELEDEYELGYWIGRPFWGQGLIVEASCELLRHAFLDLGMRRIWCGYYDGNKKSRRVQEKLGFVYHHRTEGLEVKQLGEFRVGHVMLMTREMWDKYQSEVPYAEKTV